MPSCCIKSCKNRTERGFRVFRIPRDRERKNIWYRFIRRNDLSDNSVICEAHFDKNQFEQNRMDGRKLLRSNALPTLLPPNVQLKDSVQNNNENCAVPQCSNEIGEEDETDCDTYLTKSRDDTIEKLKKKVKILLEENRKLKLKLDEKSDTLQKVFNEDQLKYLELGTHHGSCWSDETFNKAIKLYKSCGTTGYEELRTLNLPYPSSRTLQKHLQTLKVQPDNSEHILNFLKVEIDPCSEEEK